LSARPLGQQAEISKHPISLEDVFKDEVAEIYKRNRQEEDAVEGMEEKMAVEISEG